MPGFDGSGPQGQGPMTGGARGYCMSDSNGNPVRNFRGYRSRGGGRGYSRGFGRGRGWRSWFAPFGRSSVDPVSREEEITLLKNEAEILKSDLQNIHDQIATLEKTEGQNAQ